MIIQREFVKKGLSLLWVVVISSVFFLVINKNRPKSDTNTTRSKEFGVVLKENNHTDKIADLGVKYTLFSYPVEWKAYDEDTSNCYANLNSSNGLLSVSNKIIISLSTGFGWSKVENINGLYDPKKLSMPKNEHFSQFENFIKDSFVNTDVNTEYITYSGKIDDPETSLITGDGWEKIYETLGNNFNRNGKSYTTGGIELKSLVLFRVYDLYQAGYNDEAFQLARIVFENSNDAYYRNLINYTDQISFYSKITTDAKSKFIIDIIGKVFSNQNRNYYQAVKIYDDDNYNNYTSYKTALNEAYKVINPDGLNNKEIIYIKSNGAMANDTLKSENQLAYNMVKNITAISSKNSSKNIIWNLLKDNQNSSDGNDNRNGLIAENGREKPIYYAFKNINNFLSGKKFDSIIKETNDSVIYKFTDNNENIWVGWSDTNESFSIATNAENLKSANLLNDNARNSAQVLTKNNYLYNISLTSTPVIIFGDKNSSSTLTADITAVPTQIRRGQSIALSWSSAGAGNSSLKICQNIDLINCNDTFGTIAQSGSRIIQPQQTQTYLIEITDGVTIVSDSVTVTVTPDLVTTTTTQSNLTTTATTIQPDLTTTTTKIAPPPPPLPPNQTTTTSVINTTTPVTSPPPPNQTTTTSVITLTTPATPFSTTSSSRIINSTTTTTSPGVIIIGTRTSTSTTSIDKKESTTTSSTVPSYQFGNEELDKIDLVYDDIYGKNIDSSQPKQDNILTQLVGTGKNKKINIVFIVIAIIVLSAISVFTFKK